jgi:hypothetical protein
VTSPRLRKAAAETRYEHDAPAHPPEPRASPSARCGALVTREARGRLEVAVQDKRIEISAVGPHDRPQLIIHTNLREEARVGKGLEHGTVQFPGEIDIAGTAIAEAEPQSIVAENLDGRDAHEVHDPILRQRVDRLRSATILCPTPSWSALGTVSLDGRLLARN